MADEVKKVIHEHTHKNWRPPQPSAFIDEKGSYRGASEYYRRLREANKKPDKPVRDVGGRFRPKESDPPDPEWYTRGRK